MARDKGSNDHELLAAKLNHLYDTLRDAALERRYYATKLTRYSDVAKYLDVTLAFGTSGAVASWSFWKFGDGPEILWGIIGVACTVIAIAKPVFKFSDQAQRYNKIWIGLNEFFYDIKSLVDRVKTTHEYTAEMEKTLKLAEDRIKKNITPYFDPSPSRKLREKCQEEVLKELPVDRFWLPSPSAHQEKGEAK